jgi:hypothetical protein
MSSASESGESEGGEGTRGDHYSYIDLHVVHES